MGTVPESRWRGKARPAPAHTCQCRAAAGCTLAAAWSGARGTFLPLEAARLSPCLRQTQALCLPLATGCALSLGHLGGLAASWEGLPYP